MSIARVAGAVVGFTVRTYGSAADAVIEPKASTRFIRGVLMEPVGSELLAELVEKRLGPWMKHEVPNKEDQTVGLAALERFLGTYQPVALALEAIEDQSGVERDILWAVRDELEDLGAGPAKVFREALHVALDEVSNLAVDSKAAPPRMIARTLERTGEIRRTQDDHHAEVMEALRELRTSRVVVVPGPAPAPTEHPQELIGMLSVPRMKRFLELTSSEQEALRLYRWNIEMSAELYRSLHLVEVVLRNAIDNSLSLWNSTLDETNFAADWISQPASLIESVIGRDIPPALQRALIVKKRKSNGGAYHGPSHDDVLAQFTFATWRYVLPRDSRKRGAGTRRLWWQALAPAFPYLPEQDDGFELARRVTQLYDVRNRVAHLEPVLSSEENRHSHQHILYVLNAIHPVVGTWYNSHQVITKLLREKPGPEDTTQE